MKEVLKTTERLHVVMEQFTFEMEYLLKDLADGKLTAKQVTQEYIEITRGEKSDLAPYAVILEKAQKHSHKLRLHAGCLPSAFSL
jgi:DNA topoisomerase IA